MTKNSNSVLSEAGSLLEDGVSEVASEVTLLLVPPLHRLTPCPMLLSSIWKRSRQSTEKIIIHSIKEKVEKSTGFSIGSLDQFNQNRLPIRVPQKATPKTIQAILDPLKISAYCFNAHFLLSSSENTRFLDVYLFLFDDFLLITKIRHNKKIQKLRGLDTCLMCPSLTPDLQAIVKSTMLDQPIPLDKQIVKSIDPFQVR
ncbi:pleckstrin homology domain-containing family G member 7 [Mus caroli]|uniref:Pleckstrin homology domain-containing family G member 7 n=1 Tax=Mus caroli TaxID=10089 RepID=A0A6P5QFL3_MUSCR|nr:pleckstrin homology domain-containing family G member 7 [Mus caroli]